MRIAISSEAEERYRPLLDSLPVGAAHAISMTDLSRHLSVKNAELRAWVLAARMDGCFICSGQGGYYLPGDITELREYINRRNTVIDTAERAIDPSIRYIIGY